MKSNNLIKAPVIKIIFYLTFCFMSTLTFAETGHDDEEEHEEETILRQYCNKL